MITLCYNNAIMPRALTLEGFGNRVMRIAKSIERNAYRVRNTYVHTFVDSVVEHTPLLTGYARSAWAAIRPGEIPVLESNPYEDGRYAEIRGRPGARREDFEIIEWDSYRQMNLNKLGTSAYEQHPILYVNNYAPYMPYLLTGEDYGDFISPAMQEAVSAARFRLRPNRILWKEIRG